MMSTEVFHFLGIFIWPELSAFARRILNSVKNKQFDNMSGSSISNKKMVAMQQFCNFLKACFASSAKLFKSFSWLKTFPSSPLLWTMFLRTGEKNFKT